MVKSLAAAEARLRSVPDMAMLPAVAAGLQRDAVVLLVRAACAVRTDGEASSGSADDLAVLREEAKRAQDDDARRVDEAIASRDPLYFDAMDRADLALTHQALEREAIWLRSLIDLRSPAYLMGTRIGRQAALAVITVWAIYAAFGEVFPPHDLAFGKPVRASTHQEGTPDASHLVDGKISPTYDFSTKWGLHEPSWIIIDLQQQAKVRRIVVYNRSDRNFDEGLPYAIDLSTDGRNFHEVARRDTTFGDGTFLSPPWTAKVHERARYVRVRATLNMTINEVEVY